MFGAPDPLGSIVRRTHPERTPGDRYAGSVGWAQDDLQGLLRDLGVEADLVLGIVPDATAGRVVATADHMGEPLPSHAVRSWHAIGEPMLALVAVRGDEVLLAEPLVTWRGAHSTVLGHGPIMIGDRRSVGFERWLARELSRVVRTRYRRFRSCRDCGEVTPPEWWWERDVCMGCAERNHGVVF